MCSQDDETNVTVRRHHHHVQKAYCNTTCPTERQALVTL